MPVRIGVISYGANDAAIVDSLTSNRKHDVEIYAVDKQKNPFIYDRAKRHIVIPDLSDVNAIGDFFGQYKDELDFIIPFGNETSVIAGARDTIEQTIGVPVICPTREYAIERSKVYQRILLDQVNPSVNPRYKVFDRQVGNLTVVRDEFSRWIEELNYQAAIKPDRPGYGKGVGVSGDHFNTLDEMWEHFLSLYENGSVIIEEKIEGEEFSMQYFSDGLILAPTPAVRDYKRAYDEDKGPNTGSMGSYSDRRVFLPFMEYSHWEQANMVSRRIFERLRGSGRNPSLIGIPLYVAFTISKDGLKIFEINSRGGNPELINVLGVLQDDFVDVCYQMLHGNLAPLSFHPLATVATYLVPDVYPDRDDYDRMVDLSEASDLANAWTKVYPASVDAREDGLHALSSRTVCVLGIGGDIPQARGRSLTVIDAIKGDRSRRRNDIGSSEHIQKSVEHVRSFQT